MNEGPPPDDEILAMAELFGLSIAECEELRARALRQGRGRRRERWYSSARGRVRVAAWTALGGLFLIVGPGTVVFAFVSETLGWVVSLTGAAMLLVALTAIVLDVRHRAVGGAEEDEDERAVARMVSGRGIDPPA
jgi:hypothetical protein